MNAHEAMPHPEHMDHSGHVLMAAAPFLIALCIFLIKRYGRRTATVCTVLGLFLFSLPQQSAAHHAMAAAQHGHAELPPCCIYGQVSDSNYALVFAKKKFCAPAIGVAVRRKPGRVATRVDRIRAPPRLQDISTRAAA